MEPRKHKDKLKQTDDHHVFIVWFEEVSSFFLDSDLDSDFSDYVVVTVDG